MLSDSDIQSFLTLNSDTSTLQSYYDKCYTNLKSMNKRSNQITLFLLILLALFAFSSYLYKAKSVTSETGTDVYGIKISNLDIVTILTPLLCSYFIWEWCLLAKRRRGIMTIMKEISYKLFNITKENKESLFPYFNELSLNVIPFSFMIETLNVDAGSRFGNVMFWIFLTFNFVGIPTFIVYSICYNIMEFPMSFALIACHLIAIYCSIWVIYFYAIDVKNVITVLVDNKKLRNRKSAEQ